MTILSRWLPEWAPRAECAGTSTEVFDKELPSTNAMTQPVLEAKRMCVACDYTQECLAYAFEVEEQQFSVRGDKAVWGSKRFRDLIFGGLTGKQRMKIADDPDRVSVGLAILDVERFRYWREFQPVPQQMNLLDELTEEAS